MKRIHLLASSALVALSSPVTAQTYPEREIVLVVPYPAGGGIDSIARPVAEELSKQLGQPVVVENRASAGAVVGTEYVKNADPDGYTILLASTSFVSAPILNGQGNYDPATDFTKIGMVVNSPVVMLASKASGITSVEDTKEQAVEKTLRYTSAGRFSGPALAAQIFARQIRAEMREIPYGSGSAIATAILSGETDLHFSSVPPVIGQINAGAVTTIGVASEARLPALPDVPTMRELGVDFVFGNFYGFFAPNDTPPEVVSVLERALAAVAEDPAYREKVEASGSEVKFMGSADLAADITRMAAFWTDYREQVTQ